jgi:hypothetical protein
MGVSRKVSVAAAVTATVRQRGAWVERGEGGDAAREGKGEKGES